MNRVPPLLCLFLLACSQRSNTGNDDALLDGINLATPLAPGIKPVRIGEGGPAFEACNAVGEVMNLSPSGEHDLPVRAAPFVEADIVVRLSEGARVHICARSLDQHWLGVVVMPADPAADCGVSAPVASPRDYAGPRHAGWTSSAFIRAMAG